ncbi:phage tail protein [Devosia sp. Root413D1]|uniref:phage tail sheath C-terminal domain-containing protein n=1 Tax=unclassified Devosia TaxID=196773 RepID=UPI0006FE2210|nr:MULTISPECIES: phage tail sheath C-terminal domain-containing protein [unclassified Devosia]KQU97671.1 phage tail protein [Devosia sp. Root105]KQW77567.1 phage tail protein [Devosia sp. Root413D1]
MPTYLSPGIFIEEIESGSRPIEAVGTSVAGFVGTAPDATARSGEAVAVNNWQEFVKIFANGASTGTPLANAVHGFFLNGGPRCYIVNIAADAPISGGGKGLDLLAAIDEIALIAAPGRIDTVSYEALLNAAEQLGDRVALLDGPPRADDVEQLTRAATVSAEEGAPKPKRGGLRPRDSQRGFGALYFPWIRGQDAISPSTIVDIPPSGHIAGICGRIDVQRGVHKAPANTPIFGAIGLTQAISKAEQEVLNPVGVNCIRAFGREGITVWGARTLAASASNWRYLNVRRLTNMIEESIENSLRWTVFEPNDQFLWKAIRRDIGAFLTLLWRQGALMGATPAQAFFVKCDEETNPQEEIDAGKVTTLIGIAPVKPAEFVIFRIGQTAAGTVVETA